MIEKEKEKEKEKQKKDQTVNIINTNKNMNVFIETFFPSKQNLKPTSFLCAARVCSILRSGGFSLQDTVIVLVQRVVVAQFYHCTL